MATHQVVEVETSTKRGRQRVSLMNQIDSADIIALLSLFFLFNPSPFFSFIVSTQYYQILLRCVVVLLISDYRILLTSHRAPFPRPRSLVLHLANRTARCGKKGKERKKQHSLRGFLPCRSVAAFGISGALEAGSQLQRRSIYLSIRAVTDSPESHILPDQLLECLRTCPCREQKAPVSPSAGLVEASKIGKARCTALSSLRRSRLLFLVSLSCLAMQRA